MLGDHDAGETASLYPFAPESRARELVEQLPVVVYIDSDDLQPTTLYISPNVQKILGQPSERFLGDPGRWIESIHPDDRDRVRSVRDRAWKKGEPYRADYRLIRPDGREVWIRDSRFLVLGDDGQRVAWQGVLEDRTAEKRSEQDVRASEARYRALVERIPAVVYEMDRDDERRTLYVSPHVESVLGYTRAEWLDQPDIWIELLHRDDREIVLAKHDRHSETGEPWDMEYRLIASDGRVVWVHDQASLIRGRDDRPAAWHGVMIDVTVEHETRAMLLLSNEDLERRIAERTNELQEANELMALEIGERRRIEGELREARERYQQLVENMPGIAYIWDVDADGDARSFSYVSPRVADVLGFSPDEWSASRRVHPHDRDRVSEAVANSARTGEPLRLEHRYLAKEGHIVWVLDHASLIARGDDGRPSSFQGVMVDVTAVKEAESKAEQAEDRFRALTEGGPVVAFAYDLVHEPDRWPPSIELTYMSPQMADVVGYPADDLVADPMHWRLIIHPDDRERAMGQFEQSWRTGEDSNVSYRIIRSDGAVVWLRSFGRMLARDASGRPWRFQGVLFDVTEEQEQRTRLESSEAQQRTALEGANAVPWTETIDSDTGFERYTYIGPQALEILGYTPEELMVERKHFPRMVYRDDRARIRRSLVRAGATGIWEAEYRVVRRDGELRWLHSFGRRVSAPGDSPEVWQGITVDATSYRADAGATIDIAPEDRTASDPSAR